MRLSVHLLESDLFVAEDFDDEDLTICVKGDWKTESIPNCDASAPCFAAEVLEVSCTQPFEAGPLLALNGRAHGLDSVGDLAGLCPGN